MIKCVASFDEVGPLYWTALLGKALYALIYYYLYNTFRV